MIVLGAAITQTIPHMIKHKKEICKRAHKFLFFKRRASSNKFLKKCTSFEEQKGTRHILGNVCFGIFVFSCLSSTKACLRFLLICFAREIKRFYQSSLGNEVDLTGIMNLSANILAKN